MVRVFSGDFIDFAMAEEECDDSYAFVKCRDYFSHTEDIASCSAIKMVLASATNPSFLTDEEVQNFVGSTIPVRTANEFRPGDAVMVRNGYLSNLVGIVTRIVRPERYVVLFSFHTRRFRAEVSAQDMSFMTNVLVRSPVLNSRDVPSRPKVLRKRSSHECVKRRTPHRKSAKKCR